MAELTDQSDQLVTTQWRIAVKYAPTEKGGEKGESVQVNKAKDCFKNNESRLNYNASVIAHGSTDGQTKRPQWEDWLKNRAEQVKK